LPAAPLLFRHATSAHRLGEIPGEGFEPSRPLKGTPDFKSGAYHQFRHPGVAKGSPRTSYSFGAKSYAAGTLAGAFPTTIAISW
jgi:hypothetical protein